MRINFSKMKFLMFLILTSLLFLPVFAQENIISSVTVSKAKNNVNSYELNIDSTDLSNYKMSIEDDKSVYFDLKNAILADDSATYYDDVNNIDSIVVKQITGNKVRIYLQGKNVKNTEIIFSNSIIEDTKKQSKKITINKPMKEYSPVVETDLEDIENIQDWDDNSFNFRQFMSSLKDGTAGIVLIFVIIFAIIVATIRTLSKKLSQENEPLIGLRREKYNIEDEISKKVQENRINMHTNNLQDITKRAQTLQNAQEELAKAHLKYKEYLQNKYKDNTIKKQYTSDSIKKSIAINQYQKSTQNPYKNQEVIKMDKIMQNTNVNGGNFQIPPRNNFQALKTKQEVQKNTSPYIQRKSNIRENQKLYTKPNNMKFLESVTKIYEQSGRSDLADELKNSINKVKKY